MTEQSQNKSVDPIRVALFSVKGSGLHYGGPGMTAYRMYSTAEPGKLDLTLLHAWSKQEEYPLFSRQVRLAGAPKGAVNQILTARSAEGWIRDHGDEIDVFHGLQSFQVIVRTALIAQRLGVPAVVKPAAHRMDLADKGGWKALLGLPKRRRAMVKEIGGVICISNAIADEMLEYGIPESNIARIPNGVDTDQFRPVESAHERAELRARHGWDDRPVVFFSGVLNDRKRPVLVVEAIAQLRKLGMECHAVFAGPHGNREEEHMFHDAVARLDVAHDVTVLGFRTDIAELYRAADVYVLPSKSEGMPNALLEAMSSGLPSVSTRISGVTDLIDEGGQGRLIEPRVEEMVEAIGAYVNDPEEALRHGAAARKRVEDSYSGKIVAQRHVELFTRLLAGGDAAIPTE